MKRCITGLVCCVLLAAGCSSRKPADSKSVRELLDDLAHGRKDSVRLAAARVLRKRNDPAATNGLISALRDSSPAVRNEAIAALKATNDARANDALFAMTQDTMEERGVRIAAASALAHHHDSRAMNLLMEYLPTGNAAVAAAFAELGTSAVQPLVNALRESETRDAAFKILRSIGPDAVDALVGLLRDNDHRYTRLAAAKTLSEIQDARAARALEDFLRTGDRQCTASAYRFLIRRGRPESESDLIATLNDYGNLAMAEDFASSENPRLKAAADTWATSRGVLVMQRTSELPPVRWAADKQGG